MMRCGEHLGTLDCPARIIPALGASGTPANEVTRRKMMACEGVSKRTPTQSSFN